MTITLAPQIETRLRRKAARTGKSPDVLASALLLDALADETLKEDLRDEYHQLVVLELRGTLSEADATRLHAITQELDDLDINSPAAEAMLERLDETGHKLDEMLAILHTLPLAEHAR